MIKIPGKIVIVTGGVTELGKSVCQVLGQAGASLAIVDNNLEHGKAFSEKLSAKGIDCKFIKTDISKTKEVQEMIEKVLTFWGQVDVLVNTAGKSSEGFITDITDEQWDEMINTHLKGTFLACRSVLPFMIKRGSGKIVNISSVEAKQGFPLSGIHYSAAKGGILSLTRQLALQVSPLGIHVNCIAPGPMESEYPAMKQIDYQKELLSKIPLGRFAKVEEIAYAVLFLASPMAEFLTGETIDINGGKYLA